MIRPPPTSTLSPYTTLFRSGDLHANDVTADVILVGLATAVAKPSGDRVHRARFEWATQETALRRIRHARARSEEHTSELQSQSNLVCRLLLEKKKKKE